MSTRVAYIDRKWPVYDMFPLVILYFVAHDASTCELLRLHLGSPLDKVLGCLCRWQFALALVRQGA